MEFLKQKYVRLFLMIICLALWNVLLVSCSEDDGDDEGIFIQNRSEQVVIEPHSVEWVSETSVKLQWAALEDAQSYLVYDNTDDGPMIRGSLDAEPGVAQLDIVINDIDPSQSHSFRILPE